VTAACLTAPASPLADRAGYVPRCHRRNNDGRWWWLWCERPCLGCGELTANDNLRCRECDIDWLQDHFNGDYDALFAAATAPFGACGGTP
jgi:hypothetical protein